MAIERLAIFIDQERGAIVSEWEAFARTLLPAASTLDSEGLRDHADEILDAIIRDMSSPQSGAEQSEKSRGHGKSQLMERVGRLHATLRIESGFKLRQMTAEYRALRASVLRLWAGQGSDAAGVMRFNEAIDEALDQAVARFTDKAEYYQDQSLGILGHDLRNPLGAIVFGANALVNAPELSDRSVSIAARILSSAQRMSRMIADLLDLTRTRFGDLIPVVRRPTDLGPLCEQLVAEFEGLRSPAGVQFTRTGNLQGEWDADRIAQVVSNLLRNAIEHGSASDPVRLIARDNGDDVLVEVHNSGPSIPHSALARIFEPMVRLRGDGATDTGLGLGLYIASQVVTAHGGTINVTSTDDAGTTFSVQLPRLAGADRARPP